MNRRTLFRPVKLLFLTPFLPIVLLLSSWAMFSAANDWQELWREVKKLTKEIMA